MTIEDIKRINYIYYTSFRSFVKNPPSLVMCYFLFFLKTIQSILLFRFRYKEISDLLVVAPTLTDKKAVKTVLENIPKEIFSVWGNFRKDLPFALFYLRSIKGLSLFQKLYHSSSQEDKLLMRRYYYNFMLTYGIYKTFDIMLRDNPQLKMIVFTNDHTNPCRCLIEVAEKHEIKTLYVQHASVTERFPALHFSYSFLDGLDSYKKYETIGDMKGEIFLSGSPRFDDIAKIEKREKVYDVGIALNLMDNKERVLELCRYIATHYSRNIVIRPHPRMKWDLSEFVQDGYAISDSKTESSFSFLSKVLVMIANESGIHLDAALMEVPSALYNFRDSEILDWYLYIKNGLIKVLHTKEEVVETLNDGITLPEENIRMYNAAFHTKYEGKVGPMIAEFIKKETETGIGIEFMSYLMDYENGYYQYKR